MREIGIDLDKTVTRKYELKEEFKHDEIYQNGYVFVNERRLKKRDDVDALLPSVRNQLFDISIETGSTGEDVIMEDDTKQENNPVVFTHKMTIGQIAEINYAIVYKALC